MAVHPEAYDRYVSELLSTPFDSIEHRLAEAVAAILDDDSLLTLLVEVYLEDPVGTREHTIAGRLLALLFPKSVQS